MRTALAWDSVETIGLSTSDRVECTAARALYRSMGFEQWGVEPDAVCVDTGRDGESWRILFDRDRSFSRISLDEVSGAGTVQRGGVEQEAGADQARAQADPGSSGHGTTPACSIAFPSSRRSGVLKGNPLAWGGVPIGTFGGTGVIPGAWPESCGSCVRGGTKALAFRNRAIVELGRRHGIPTPVNERLLRGQVLA